MIFIILGIFVGFILLMCCEPPDPKDQHQDDGMWLN
jgi:hypothetical protein